MTPPSPVHLYRARWILPIDRPPIEDGAMLVREGHIVAVGRNREVEIPAGTAITDYGDAILLPPLVNAHTHLELTDYPLWAAEFGETETPGSFVGWIRQVIRVKRQLSPERFEASLRRGIASSLTAGTGAVGDILSWLPARAGYADSPLRGRLFLETLGLDPGLYRPLLASLRQVLREKQAGLLQLGLGPHSPYTLSEQHLEEVLTLARQQQFPLTIHLGESAAERQFLADSQGEIASELYPLAGWQGMLPLPARQSPVHWLEARGGLLPEVLLAHGVQADAADAGRLAAAGATVVLCPRSNARLQVGKAPLALYRQAGVFLALGTDSRASSDSLSVWDEIAFARSWFAGELPPRQWLTIATAGGAESLGLGREMGRLAPGCGAHFQVLLPPDRPHFSEVEEFLCSSGRSAEVRHLFLGGVDRLQ